MRKQIFDRSAKALLFTFLINSVVDLFVYTFFTAHILSITNNNIVLVSQFYILMYCVLGVMFFLLVSLAKKLKHINMFRIGVILKGIFILLIVLLGDGIVQHFMWLGMVYGLIESVFWTGGNTIKTLVVESDKIKPLISFVSINARLVGIICPIAFGISIDAISFNHLAIFILVVVVMQIISTFLIKQIKLVDKKSKFKQFFAALKTNDKNNFIKKSYLMIFFRGLQYFVPTYITYLIIFVLKTNTSLGILTTVASVVAILILLLFNVIRKIDSNIWLYASFSLLEAAALILCIIFMNPVFIVIFQVVYTATKTTVDAMSEALRSSSIRDANLGEYTTESIAISEVCLNGGRMIGYTSLLLLGLSSSLTIAIILGLVIVVFLSSYNIYTGIVKHQVERANEQQLCVENTLEQEKTPNITEEK